MPRFYRRPSILEFARGAILFAAALAQVSAALGATSEPAASEPSPKDIHSLTRLLIGDKVDDKTTTFATSQPAAQVVAKDESVATTTTAAIRVMAIPLTPTPTPTPLVLPPLIPPPGGPKRFPTLTPTPIPFLLLDVNFASVEQFSALPGMDIVRAENIVRFRSIHGPFERMEDLTEVHGITERLLHEIRPFITLNLDALKPGR